MKKLLAVSVLAVMFLTIALPLSWADESEMAEPEMSGTPDEYKDMEKTLKQGRIDTIEARISDLNQANKFLSERVNMLERSVNDLKDKVDRSFR
jgi:cell division protein FtsB